MTGYAMPHVATVVEHCATGGRRGGDSSRLRGAVALTVLQTMP